MTRGLVRQQRRVSPFMIPEMEHFFRNVPDLFTSSFQKESFPIDLYEEEDKIVLGVDAPGVEPEKIRIQVFSDRVSLNAETTQEESTSAEGQDSGKTWHLRKEERRLNYTIALPKEVNPDNARAEIKDGVVRVIMPKKEAEQGKTLELSRGEA